MKKAFLMGCGAIGAFTAAEARKGRYMRAPDHDAEFAEFEKAGTVEQGKSVAEADAEAEAGKEPKPRQRGPKPAAAAGKDKPAAAAAATAAGEDEPGDDDDQGAADDEDGGDDEDDEDGDDEEKKPKPKPKASERIRELNKRLRNSERLRLADADRIDKLEKASQNGGLPGAKSGGNSADEIGDAPDPADEAKYPLGHLDDRYIEDKLEWLATKKAAERADAVLQRQQEGEQTQAAERAQAALLEKVDDLTERGSEQFDDFQETVVEAGMRGAWRLEQATFEAAHEAEHGAQILYDLSRDKAEAKRVAELSPYQQMRFVMDEDAKIAAKAKPRKIPGAGAPPSTTTRGANSRTRIDPSTDNLDDFEKAWLADEKGKR